MPPIQLVTQIDAALAQLNSLYWQTVRLEYALELHARASAWVAASSAPKPKS